MLMSLCRTSHLKLIASCRLPATEQMQTPVTIDVNKFLEAFSIKAEGQVIHPPSCIAGEASFIFSPAIAVDPGLPSGAPTSFTMEDYSRYRRAEAIRWIDLQEKRASIIARLQPVTPQEYQ